MGAKAHYQGENRRLKSQQHLRSPLAEHRSSSLTGSRSEAEGLRGLHITLKSAKADFAVCCCGFNRRNLKLAISVGIFTRNRG